MLLFGINCSIWLCSNSVNKNKNKLTLPLLLFSFTCLLFLLWLSSTIPERCDLEEEEAGPDSQYRRESREMWSFFLGSVKRYRLPHLSVRLLCFHQAGCCRIRLRTRKQKRKEKKIRGTVKAKYYRAQWFFNALQNSKIFDVVFHTYWVAKKWRIYAKEGKEGIGEAVKLHTLSFLFFSPNRLAVSLEYCWPSLSPTQVINATSQQTKVTSGDIGAGQSTTRAKGGVYEECYSSDNKIFLAEHH